MNRIRLWWRFEGQYLHKNFVRGIQNLWRWAPTIWRDRDWDHAFIYDILAKKLEFQAKYISDRDFHTEAKRDAERMRLVVRLIELQSQDFYATEYLDYEESKQWFEPCQGRPGYSEWKRETVSERHDEYFAKYPRQYKRVVNGEGVFAQYQQPGHVVDLTDKHRIAMEIAHMNQDRCRELIFRIMSDHIERWWD